MYMYVYIYSPAHCSSDTACVFSVSIMQEILAHRHPDRRGALAVSNNHEAHELSQHIRSAAYVLLSRSQASSARPETLPLNLPLGTELALRPEVAFRPQLAVSHWHCGRNYEDLLGGGSYNPDSDKVA
jgi:hypothetical protein